MDFDSPELLSGGTIPPGHFAHACGACVNTCLRVRALALTRRTWRCVLLTAIVVSTKVVFDETVFLADFRDRLPSLRLGRAAEQEGVFLSLINYSTTVRTAQFARYYFGLLDVAPKTLGQLVRRAS